MCVKGWRRGEGSWRTTRRWEEVRTSSLPDSDAGRAATLAASMECCRYGNMRRVDENMYVRIERWHWITHNQKGRCCYKCGVVREEDRQVKWRINGWSTVRVMPLSCTLPHSKRCSNTFCTFCRWRWQTGEKRADGTQIETGSNDVTLSLSLSGNSHGNWVSTSTRSASHPPSPLHTPPGAFCCCGDGGSTAKWKEGGDKWALERLHHHLWVLQWADVSPAQKQHVYTAVLRAREKRSRERPSLSRIHLLKSPFRTVKKAISEGHPFNQQQPRSR